MFAVQSVYDKQRNNEKEILDLKDQISSLKDELKKKISYCSFRRSITSYIFGGTY